MKTKEKHFEEEKRAERYRIECRMEVIARDNTKRNMMRLVTYARIETKPNKRTNSDRDIGWR